LFGVKGKLEGSESAAAELCAALTTDLSGNRQGPKPECRDELVQQLQEELTKAEAQRFEKEALYRWWRQVTTSPYKDI